MICKTCGEPGVLFSRDDTGRIELCQECYDAQTAAKTLRANLRCGDEVKNIPSGEIWEVAYADYATGYLSPCGWPYGEAKISDCVLVNACTDEEHAKAVARWLDTPRHNDPDAHDRRIGMVRRLYRPDEEARMVREAIGRECHDLARRIETTNFQQSGVGLEWRLRMSMVLREFARDCGVAKP